MISFKRFALESWATTNQPSGDSGEMLNMLSGDVYPEVTKGWYNDDGRDRPMVLLDLPKGKLAFYQSSEGTSGKEAGDWYPFFGIGSQGYIIKGEVSKMNTGYNQPQIKEIMNTLNSYYPPVNSDKFDVTLFRNGVDGTDISKQAYGENEFHDIREISAQDVGKEFFESNVVNLIKHIYDILTNLGFTVSPEDIVKFKSENREHWLRSLNAVGVS